MKNLLIYLTLIFTPFLTNAQGNMLSFDGLDDYVQLSGTFGGASQTEMTIESWIYIDATTGSIQAILSSGNVAEFVHFQLTQDLKISLTAYVNPEVGQPNSITVPQVAHQLSLNQWYHIAVVLKSGESKFYLNGVQSGPDDTILFTSVKASSNVSIGRGFGGSRYFEGKVDELRIWNTARSAHEIRLNMHKKELGSNVDLRAFYSFDNVASCNGTAGEIEDESTNSFDGTCNQMNIGNLAVSDGPIGQITVTDHSIGVTNAPTTIGDINFDFNDGFDLSQDMYVSKVENLPNDINSIPGSILIDSAYYIVETYENGGSPGVFEINATFTNLNDAISGEEQLDPTPLVLMNRDKTSANNWSSLKSADSATSNTIKFNNVLETSQYIVTRTSVIAQGKMVNFDGVNDAISLSGSFGGSGLNQLTIETWVYLDGTTGDLQAILSSQGLDFLHFQIGTNNNVFCTVYTGIAGGGQSNFSLPQDPFIMSLNTWYQISVVLDPGASKFYVDGVQQGPTILTDFEHITQSSTVTIGRGFSGSRHLKGSINELRLWDTARSEDEIRTNLHKKITGTETNLMAYYSFNNATTCDGTSGEIEDESPNSYDGTCLFMTDDNLNVGNAPIGEATVSKILNVVDIVNVLGSFEFQFNDVFDNTQDVYLTEFTSQPNTIDGISETNVLQDRYYLLKLFENGGSAGTFDVNLSINLPSGYIDPQDTIPPSGLVLYKRADKSNASWVDSISSASATTSQATFNGISSFSQLTIASNNSSLGSGPGLGTIKAIGMLNINNSYSFPVLDGSPNQILTTDGFGTTTWKTMSASDTSVVNEIQDLSLSNDILQITNNGSATAIDLTPYLADSDMQMISYAQDSLEITSGNKIRLVPDKLTDADQNTNIEVEQSANEDIIRFNVAGVETMQLNGSGLEVSGNVTISNLLNMVATSVVPSSPVNGDIYLDDGTNNADTLIGFRYYNGTMWIDI